MTTFNEWLELPATKKIFLIDLNVVKQMTGFVVYGAGPAYSAAMDREISAVAEDGSAYTEKASVAEVETSAASFYWDRAAGRLYIHTSGGDDPAGYAIIATHTLYLANLSRSPYNARHYDPRIKGIPSFQRQMQQVFFGRSAISYGNLEVLNDDGALDYLVDWTVAGQEFSCKLGGPGIDDSAYQVVLSGIMDKMPEMTRGALKIPIKDNARRLKKKIPETFLAAGANVPDENVNKPIPLCFGTCYNVRPLWTNNSTNEYQVHAGRVKDIPAVYQDRTALTLGVDWAKDAANGTFTLANPATGTITCDVEGAYDGADFPELPGEIIKKILDDHAGFAAAEYDSAALTQLDTDRPYELGVFLGSQKEIMAVFDEIGESVCATWGFERTGKLTAGAISDPGSSADVEFTDRDYMPFALKKDRIPEVVHRVIVEYRKDWSKSRENDTTRTAKAEDAAVLYQFPFPGEKTIESLLRDEADAEAVASLYLTLLKKQLFFPVFTTKGKAFRLNFLDDVKVANSRYGIDGYYKIIGLKEDYTKNEVELTCYGG